MPSSLEYPRIEPPDHSLALPAFICGICSGPTAIGLAVLAGANHLPEQTKEFLALLALAAVLGGALVFACLARLTVSVGASARSRRFANMAIAAPIAWCVAIFAFVAYALSQV